ncbi:MAG: two-component system sensor histidine kinase NtrB [Janthinobacterium lividum]
MSLVVRVIAPTGRDAELITKVLRENDVPAQVGSTSTLLQGRSEQDPLGPLLIAEEALHLNFIQQLSNLIHKQPAWSDLPILILTGSGRETTQTHRLQHARIPLGSPILLERPIRTATLVSSVKAALRARARQYEVRDTVAEVKQQRETLQVMLDNLPVGVLLAKPSGEMVVANRRLEALLRHPVSPIAEMKRYEDWPTFYPDGIRVEGKDHPLARAMKSGHSLAPEEYLYARGDGTEAWISLAASPILNEVGTVKGGVLTVLDVDQQKRSELALIQNEKLAAVGRLAASISHEINNPLEAVTNLLYLARGSTELPAEIREYLDSADRELARVSQIVSHTLRFHKQSTNPRAITAKELLEPTLGLYAGRLTNANISLVLEERSQALVTCYEGEIRQLLNNLVGNAIDSMKTGGRLLIRTQDSHLWKTGKAGLRITIADEGYGISPAVRMRVFEPFFTTKGINGTGLGLWISRGIVDKHQGMLQLRSSTKEGSSGTVFSLLLPLQGPA